MTKKKFLKTRFAGAAMLLLAACTALAADVKTSALTALTTPAAGDLLRIVDVSDTSSAATGTTKKITFANFSAGVTPAFTNLTGVPTTAAGYSITGGAALDVLAVKTLTGSGAIVLATSPTLAGATISAPVLTGNVTLDKTITTAGTTGAQTINKATGSVNFAAGAASVVVTNSLVSASSIVQVTVASNDATMRGALVVKATGSFTIYADAVPTAETAVQFTVTN